MGAESSVANTVTSLPKSMTVEEREAQDITKLIIDAQEHGRDNIRVDGLLSSDLKKQLKDKNYEIRELITIKKRVEESRKSYKFIYKDQKYLKCWIECCCCIPICVCANDDENPPFTTIKWKIPEKDIELHPMVAKLPASAPPAYNPYAERTTQQY